MLVIPIILGSLSGRLVNYLADVLPVDGIFSCPDCPVCKKKYSWTDYFLYRNCTNCGKRRGLRNPVVHIMLMVAIVLIWIIPGQILPFLLAFILLVYLMLVLVIDLEHRLILHPVSIIGAFLGMGIGLFMRGKQSLTYGIVSTLLGGIAGFGITLVFYFLGRVFIRQFSKKRGLANNEVALGFGDVCLSGILGLLLGWQVIMTCLLYSILAGGLVSLIILFKMLIAKKYRVIAIPYAPFLILSAFYILFIQYDSLLHIQ